MLLATACWPAILAADVTTIFPDRSFFLLPAEIAKDGKAFVYTYNNEDRVTKTVKFTIYDDDFQQAKEFITIPGTPNDYCYQTQERENVPVSATIYNDIQIGDALNINGISEGLTIESVVNALNASNHLNSNWEIVTLENGNKVVAITSTYYNESYFGKKYPEYVYMQVNGLWYYFHLTYDTQYGPYGEWKEADTHQSDGKYPSITPIVLLPLDGSDEQSFYLTRGIFSDECCYVLPEYKKVEFSKEYTYNDTDWVYRKEWGYKSEIIAFKAYDSSNNEIAIFDIPEGYTPQGESLEFLRFNDKRYVTIEIEKPGTTEYGLDYFTAIYRLDENNKVSQIAIAPSTRISPRTPRQGEIVTVTFDENYTSSPKNINIVSASGQNVFKTKLPAGQSSIDLDTSRLNQGMYIVTVSTDSKSQEATKIIVR